MFNYFNHKKLSTLIALHIYFENNSFLKGITNSTNRILFLSSRLSAIMWRTNSTSPPGKILSVTLAVQTERGSARSLLQSKSNNTIQKGKMDNQTYYLLVLAIPHASKLLAKNGGLHIQKSNFSGNLFSLQLKISRITPGRVFTTKKNNKRDS